MNIRQKVDDVIFLLTSQRYEAALTILLVAIAASSRCVFPKKLTKSFKNPKDTMRDGEAFELFLGGQLTRVMRDPECSNEYGCSGFKIGFRGEEHFVESIFYKYYRCELFHEGALPLDVLLMPEGPLDASASTGAIKLYSDKVVLNAAWFNVLIECVAGAECNLDSFGRTKAKYVKNENVSNNFIRHLAVKYLTSEGRITILMQALFRIRLVDENAVDRVFFVNEFDRLVLGNFVNLGSISGLSFHGLTTKEGKLTAKGIDVLLEIDKAYSLVWL